MDSLFARLLSWRFRRPFVCHLRLAPPSRFCAQYRWGLQGASRFIANSVQTRNDYAAAFLQSRPPIDMVHNGIDVRKWRPPSSPTAMRNRVGVNPDTFLIVYAGRLHWEKGLDVAIDALAALAEPADLVIAGRELDDGSGRRYEAELREHAKVRGVERRCHFVGQVAAMADLYGAADVTVLPSFSETFGRILIESMACGTPAVASRVGGMPEVLTGEFDRHLFPAGDAGALVERLERLRHWRERDPELAVRCRVHAKRFDIGQTVAGIEAALQNTIDESRGKTLAALPATGAN
jgi:glycosyltransferase involved in cell wall biosynthesis